MKDIKLDEYVIDSLTDFGRGVCTEVALVSVVDGLKVSYRRVINTLLNSQDKLMKTASISGLTLATTHPHNVDALDSVIAALVRFGVFDGQGNFGMKLIYGQDIAPAASRYTEAKLNSKWRKLLSNLMPYVPYKEAEIEGNMEPEYLPTPIPMILLFSGMGISYGAGARYPMFTAKSIYEALINDNPYLLEAPNGLILDKENSELDKLWTTGLGKLTYKYTVEKTGISSGYGSMISGSAELFKPNLEKVFEEELSKGQIYILDQTNSDIPKVFVGRSPNVRAISLDDIQSTCEYACTYSRVFRLTVTDGQCCYCIPLREWLKETYENYLTIVDKYKQDQILKLEFEYEVYDWLKIVAECLINNRDFTPEQLAEATGCKLEVVKSIIRKTISTLRNTDSTDKLKYIKSKLKEFKDLDPVEFVKSVIDEF